MRFFDRFIARPPHWFRILVPSGIFRIPSKGDKPRVFLTFDDGPIPEITPWVLDILDEFSVKATFFMVGENAERYPEVVEEVRRRGHGIGNHTHHHLRGIKVSTGAYLRDVEIAARILHTDMLRPPHGWLRPLQALALKSKYRIIMYDLVTLDYSSRLTADEVFENVRRLVRDGSIIVFHDSLKSSDRLLEALPKSIEYMQSEGYEFHLL